MSDDIQFDEDPQFLYSRGEASNKTPKMVEWIANNGFGGDTKKATSVLLVIAAVAVIIAIAWPIVFGGGGNATQEGTAYPNEQI